MKDLAIVLIGAGNLATHLAVALHDSGHRILAVGSRTLRSAKFLAEGVGGGVVATDCLQELPPADLYILAVSDDTLPLLSQTWHPKNANAIVVHTAGSVAMSVLTPVAEHVGVFYPLQTFTRNRQLDFASIPCFVEGNTPWVVSQLKEWAQSLCHEVHILDSSRRKTLHLSAVFACNFVNHLYDVAGELLEHEGLSRVWLAPLIAETARKWQDFPIGQAQTGPAKRGDQSVMSEQIKGLEAFPQWQKIYQVLSESIYHRFHS